ncbi:hypothetical protein H2248_011937 [Termitomyces sp. 'cryptogamus']|nr:hypothetical protein H2248_011937 [Termitomyces sp. 'cryptogamus']
MNSTSEGTIVASRAQANGRTARPYTPPPPSATSEMSESTFTKRYKSNVNLDDYGTSIWKKRPTAESDELKSILRPPLKVQIEPVSPTSDSNPQQLSSFPPSLPPPHRSVTPLQLDLHPPAQLHLRRPPASASKGPRGNVYERLEEFFPEHDLDKLVIEASSGGSSPMAVEPAVTASPILAQSEREKTRARNKNINSHCR